MTALQTLIAKWEAVQKESDNSDKYLFDYFIADAKAQLSIEQEQIETAYYDGGDDVCPNGVAGGKKAALYYKSISNSTTLI